ncbi:MAG: hypothetical protein IJ733_08090, partial [Lachnospiraceae bacterium]|nr:hypothetical protein [Lachnospiraceae bacterium]
CYAVFIKKFNKTKGSRFMEERKKNLVVTIDEELHHKFKVYCTEQKTTIKEMTIKLILKELKAHERK